MQISSQSSPIQPQGKPAKRPVNKAPEPELARPGSARPTPLPQAPAKGSALTHLSLDAPPTFGLGLKAGDRLSIDGTLSADGNGQIRRLDARNIEIQAEVNIPGLVRGLADDYFGLRNGKVDLSVRLNQGSDGQWRYQLYDHVKGKSAGSGKSPLTVSEKQSGGRQSQTLTAQTRNGKLVIQIHEDARGKISGSFSIPGLPGALKSFDFTRP
jgi:hypothetical protein